MMLLLQFLPYAPDWAHSLRIYFSHLSHASGWADSLWTFLQFVPFFRLSHSLWTFFPFVPCFRLSPQLVDISPICPMLKTALSHSLWTFFPSCPMLQTEPTACGHFSHLFHASDWAYSLWAFLPFVHASDWAHSLWTFLTVQSGDDSQCFFFQRIDKCFIQKVSNSFYQYTSINTLSHIFKKVHVYTVAFTVHSIHMQHRKAIIVCMPSCVCGAWCATVIF